MKILMTFLLLGLLAPLSAWATDVKNFHYNQAVQRLQQVIDNGQYFLNRKQEEFDKQAYANRMRVCLDDLGVLLANVNEAGLALVNLADGTADLGVLPSLSNDKQFSLLRRQLIFGLNNRVHSYCLQDSWGSMDNKTATLADVDESVRLSVETAKSLLALIAKASQ